jgi:UDP-N-acetylmuramoyl-tripeptide--D-alanyl-D-alanine ligase
MNTVTFGALEGAAVVGELIEGETAALRYTEEDFRSEEIVTGLVGNYNFSNILAAACIGRHFGVPHSEIKNRLESYSPGLNRSQLVRTDKNTIVLDAYNANPSSMELALDNFAGRSDGPKLAILGQMNELGETSNAEHQSLVNRLRDLKVDAYLVGPLFNNVDSMGFPRFADTADLMNFLEKNPVKDSVVLLKGSRSVALEKVVEKL